VARFSGRPRFLTLVAFASAAWAEPKPTAVYTLDHRHEDITADDPRGLRNALDGWARGCRIVEGGAIYRLECEPPAKRRESEEDIESLPATLALFRDLEETVYLAACPMLDDERIRRMERESDKSKEERAVDPELEADLADCADVETGRTFTAEVEGDEMRIVIRGRQLRLILFETQPRTRTTSTPYTPAATRGSLGHAGPPTMAETGPNPAPDPAWQPPSEPPASSRPRNPEASLRDPGVAKTSLRSGRVRVECGLGAAEVWIDGAFLGSAPLDAPLPAGRHAVVAKSKKDGNELETPFELDAGQTLKIDACAER
jgi:hypothetical protein